MGRKEGGYRHEEMFNFRVTFQKKEKMTRQLLKLQKLSLLFWFSGSRVQEKHETSKPTGLCRKTSFEICTRKQKISFKTQYFLKNKVKHWKSGYTMELPSCYHFSSPHDALCPFNDSPAATSSP